MSISTLSRISVPLDSDDSNSSQGLLMPKLQYRFRVTFENFGISTPTTELTKQVIDFTKPTVSHEEITLDVYNSKAYLAGKPQWETVEVNLRDDVNNSVQRLVGEQNQKQFDFFEQASAASGIDYKFTTRLEVLDGGNGALTPNVLETFEMYGCFVQNTSYNSLGYSNNDVNTITLTLRYDNAIQVPNEEGIGAPVGRPTGDNVTGGGR